MQDARDRLIPAYGVLERKGIPLEELQDRLTEEGWPTYVLRDAPTDKDQFFASVRAVLPLDPPVQTSYSWDALSDSLWEGLHQLGVETVAIVWPQSEQMMHAEGEAYPVAIDILTDLVFSLADPKFTVDHVTRVLVLLA
jgi:hypothetical protein